MYSSAARFSMRRAPLSSLFPVGILCCMVGVIAWTEEGKVVKLVLLLAKQHEMNRC